MRTELRVHLGGDDDCSDEGPDVLQPRDVRRETGALPSEAVDEADKRDWDAVPRAHRIAGANPEDKRAGDADAHDAGLQGGEPQSWQRCPMMAGVARHVGLRPHAGRRTERWAFVRDRCPGERRLVIQVACEPDPASVTRRMAFPMGERRARPVLAPARVRGERDMRGPAAAVGLGSGVDRHEPRAKCWMVRERRLRAVELSKPRPSLPSPAARRDQSASKSPAR